MNMHPFYRVGRAFAALALIMVLLLPLLSVAAQGGTAQPIFKATDEALPAFVCGADAFASYYTLQQIQIAGLDVQNGFRLGIVPFYLEDSSGAYDLGEDARAERLQNGTYDCLLTTLENVALRGQGVITAVVDESAGADQIWVRGQAETLNDLKGKRIAYSEGSVGQFMVLYAMAVAGLRPGRDVTVLEADSVSAAVEAFNKGEADAVSGWEPDINKAAESGGVRLIGSEKLRVVADVILTSRKAIAERAEVVTQFHRAWFAALKAQIEDFPTAARQIAEWGYNDWSGVSVANAERDLRGALESISQATLANNLTVMNEPSILVGRMDVARRVWSLANIRASEERTVNLVEPRFVLALADAADLTPNGAPINPSFLMGSRPKIETDDQQAGQTLAVLPCRRFDFLPDSTILTRESRRILEVCVLPVMQSTAGTFLKIVGASAWPGPAGTFTEQDIRDFGLARAISVRDFLVSKGIDPSRFVIDTALPPAERRESEDEDVQALDRYVELTLFESGR